MDSYITGGTKMSVLQKAIVSNRTAQFDVRNCIVRGFGTEVKF